MDINELSELFEKKKIVPILLIGWALCATIFATASATSNFDVKLPVVRDLFSTNSAFEVESTNFKFNISDFRFHTAEVTLKNTDENQRHRGVLTIYLYNNDNTRIAVAEKTTGMFSPGVRLAVTVDLDWYSGYNAMDFSHGEVIVSQTE